MPNMQATTSLGNASKHKAFISTNTIEGGKELTQKFLRKAFTLKQSR